MKYVCPQKFTPTATSGNITVHDVGVTYHVQVSATLRGRTGILMETELSPITEEATIRVPPPGKSRLCSVVGKI